MSVRHPNPDRSAAVLIGFSDYQNSAELPAIPAVKTNVADLAEVLTAQFTGVIARDGLHVVTHPDGRPQIGAALSAAAAKADDLLLVYYAGHGLVDEQGLLFLSLPETDPAPSQLDWSAFTVETLRRALATSRAATKVLILDCCFSGRAFEAMASERALIAGQVDISGTFTMTSTTANAPSHAPVGASHTSFTGALLTALRSPEPLTLDQLFDRIDADLMSRGLPRPQRRAVNAAHNAVLCRPATLPSRPGASHLPAAPITHQDRLAVDQPSLASLGSLGERPSSTRQAQKRIRAASDGNGLQLALTFLPALLAVATVATGTSVGRTMGGADAFSAYVLPFGVAMALAVLLGDRVSHRSMFMAGMVVFGAASVLDRLSTPFGVLFDTARAGQGVGAGLLTAFGLALVAASPDSRRRRMLLGIWIAGTAVVVFLTTGGLMNDMIWATMEMLTIPLTGAVLVLVPRRFPQSLRLHRWLRWPAVGLVLTGLALVIWALTLINRNQDGDYPALALAPAISGLVLLGGAAALGAARTGSLAAGHSDGGAGLRESPGADEPLSDARDIVMVLYRSSRNAKVDADGRVFGETGLGEQSSAQLDADRQWFTVARNRRDALRGVVYVFEGQVIRVREVEDGVWGEDGGKLSLPVGPPLTPAEIKVKFPTLPFTLGSPRPMVRGKIREYISL